MELEEEGMTAAFKQVNEMVTGAWVKSSTKRAFLIFIYVAKRLCKRTPVGANSITCSGSDAGH